MSAARITTSLFTVGLLFCGWTSTAVVAQEPKPPVKFKQAAKRTPAQAAAPAQTVEQPQPVLPAGPLPPLTLAESPAIPPKVSYGNGQLTIVAQNSTLGDVLRAVRTQTGATMDIPPTATERVVAHLGPGPAREVMAALLNGSHFNYVILGSTADPTAVQQIILTPKQGEQGAAANPEPRRQPEQQAEEETAEEPAADDSANDAENQDQSQPEEQPAQQPAPPAVKSPEELLRELQLQQQMQQQLQQQQQQQGGTQPQNPPQPQ